ncbi:MAG: hypothetical protein ACOC44_08890 [Promethearchaeia archaeon]
MATLFLFLPLRFDIIGNEITRIGLIPEIGSTELIIAGVYVLFFGTFFLIGLLFTNFYFGRIITYFGQGNSPNLGKLTGKVIQIFGLIWSFQFLISFLIPNISSIIIFGILHGFLMMILYLLSKTDIQLVQGNSRA